MHLHYLIPTLSFLSLATAQWTTYTVPHSSGEDDALALNAALSADASLTTNATILFQRGVTYNILTPVKFPTFQNVIVSIQGNITYASDIDQTQGEIPNHFIRTLSANA